MNEYKHLGLIFDYGEVDKIDYVRTKTNLLDGIKDEEVNVIYADMHDNILIHLNNGKVIRSNTEEVIDNVKELVQLDYLNYVVITNDNKIIPLNNENFKNYFGDTTYDKIETCVFGIIALKDGNVKLLVVVPLSVAIDIENFKDVEDIECEGEEFLIYKNGEWKDIFVE